MKPIVVLSQSSPKNNETYAEQNLRVFSESAKLAGCVLYHVPLHWDDVTPEDALCFLPEACDDSDAVFVGYINDNSYYHSLNESLLGRHIKLINTPAQSETAMEFEKFYPLIRELTPKSVVIRSEGEIEGAIKELGFPVFTKGGIKSDKEGGWAACVVDSMDELIKRWKWCARRPITARRTMVVRQLAPLRKSGMIKGGFPESREYRVFLFNGEVLGYGYYWSAEDPFGELTEEEVQAVKEIASTAALRIGCPLMAVDVGEQDDKKWIVVETGDLQYSGVSQMPHLLFWNLLSDRLSHRRKLSALS